jgi:hypothetical protein
MVGGEHTTCASTASFLNLRRASARRPLTHSQGEGGGGEEEQGWHGPYVLIHRHSTPLSQCRNASPRTSYTNPDLD